jgi:hypothetical protein
MTNKPPRDMAIWQALAVVILITVAVLAGGWLERLMPQ